MLTIPLLAGLCWVVWAGYAAGQFRPVPLVGGVAAGMLTPFVVRRLPAGREAKPADQLSARRQLVVSFLASIGGIAVFEYVLAPVVPAWVGRWFLWGLLGWGVALVSYAAGDAVWSSV
jgi:hypothetical protein